MSVKVNVGLSKKIGQPDYGSLGATSQVEFEMDGGLDNSSAQHFQAAMRRAYAACREAVETEIAAARGDREGSGQHDDSRRDDRGGNGGGNRRVATASQIRAIHAIANRHRIDLPARLQELFGVSQPEDLSAQRVGRSEVN